MLDREIITLFLARDEEALHRTEEQYGAYCKSIARNILDDAGDAEECFNDALLAVWNTIPPQTPDSLKAYIGTLVRHTALDRAKRKNAQKRGGTGRLVNFEELKECIPDTEDIADRTALKITYERFLSSLKKRDRTVFLQKYWYFSSISEIACAHGMSESAVKMSLSRTKAKLSSFLKREGFD